MLLKALALMAVLFGSGVSAHGGPVIEPIIFGPPVNQTTVFSAVQDATGVVWAIGTCEKTGQNTVCSWKEGQWLEAHAAAEPDSVDEAWQLTKGPDGAVFGIWQWWYTRHLDQSYSKFGGMSGIADVISVCADSKGDNWLLWDDPKQFFAADRDVELFLKSEFDGTNQCFVHSSLSQTTMGAGVGKSVPYRLFKDPLGRFWFFDARLAWGILFDQLRPVVIFDPTHTDSRAPARDDPHWSALLNAMVYDGKSAYYQCGDAYDDGIARAKNSGRYARTTGTQLLFLEQKDAQSLWAGFANDGLYEIDMNTCKGRPADPPAPEGFVQRIFRAGETWYLITGGPEKRTENGYCSTLWALREKQWQKVISGLDFYTWCERKSGNVSPDFNLDILRRPVLVTERGFWIGAYGTGPWFVPANGDAPVHLTWRRKCRLANINTILKLSDGKIMFVSDLDGTLVGTEEELLNGTEKEPLVVRPRLVRDKTGRLWGYLADQPGKISRWDGTQWRHFDLPPEFLDNEGIQLGCDSLNRVWAFNAIATAPALTITEDDTVQFYNSYLDAVLGQKGQRYDFSDITMTMMTPVHGEGGQIALLSPDAFYLHDGQKWIVSSRSLIHEVLLNSFSFWTLVPCRFTPEGRPRLVSSYGSAEFAAPDRWKSLPREKDVPSRPPDPVTTIADGAGNEFSSPVPGNVLAYRMSPPERAAEETVAVPAQPVPSPVPSPPTVEQVQTWVSLLTGADEAKRSTAAKSLVASGKAALAALREARNGADQNVLWWIDATIEEIERREE